MKVVLVTGGFDPLHSGHLSYLQSAKELGDILVVGINSDEWLTNKKGKPFMPLLDRVSIIQNLTMVDEYVLFDDLDNSAVDAIKQVRSTWPDSEIIFANGGDRTSENIPEMEKIKDKKLSFQFGIGGVDKQNSSSVLLAKWNGDRVYRNWGWYRTIDQGHDYKVKELEILPGKKLSMQRHQHRAERWNVVHGSCVMETEFNNIPDNIILNAHGTVYTVEKQVWHRAINNTNKPCKIIEVQIGVPCTEDDIERRD